jgi:exosome complex component RRP4
MGSNVYVANGKIHSKVIGIYNDEGEYANVVALEGGYEPRRDDVVIGAVIRAVHAGYEIDINGPVTSFIPRGALREDLREGDLISAKVSYVDEMKQAELDFPRTIFGGEILEVTPVKVPRFIGKNASMLEVLKEGTGSTIIIGKNGRVWAKGGNIELLKKALEFIEENSHKSSLTNAVEDLLKKK